MAYRDDLSGNRYLTEAQREDLEWLKANPPESKLAKLRKEEEWDNLMERNGCYRRATNGSTVPGVNFQNLDEYEVNAPGLLKGRLRIDSKGSVVPYLCGDAKLVPLPAGDRPLTAEETETRKNWLFGLKPKARAARYRVVEHIAHLKMKMTEEEKLDRQYLKMLHTPDGR